MISSSPAAARPLGTLTVWYALALVVGYVVAQVLGGMLVGMVWRIDKGFESAFEGSAIPAGIRPSPDLLAWSVLVGLLLAAVWAVLFAWQYAREVLRDPGPQGVAWRPAQLRGYALAVLLAVLLMLLAILVEQLYPPDLSRLTGPAEQLARTHGLPFGLFFVCVVVIAPLLEEFVFRGVAFAAVARSFGTSAAVVLTTLAFVALHYADKIHYWPGFLLVGALGLAAAGLRLRYKSLWPGVLMHCGYNAMILLLH